MNREQMEALLARQRFEAEREVIQTKIDESNKRLLERLADLLGWSRV